MLLIKKETMKIRLKNPQNFRRSSSPPSRIVMHESTLDPLLWDLRLLGHREHPLTRSLVRYHVLMVEAVQSVSDRGFLGFTGEHLGISHARSALTGSAGIILSSIPSQHPVSPLPPHPPPQCLLVEQGPLPGDPHSAVPSSLMLCFEDSAGSGTQEYRMLRTWHL